MKLEGYVRVTNGTDQVICGRFDGQDYEFPPETPKDVPEEVAMHIFAFGQKDKAQAMAMLGWASTSAQLPEALRRLEKISFEEPPEQVDAPPKKAAAKRIGDAASPLVKPGGPRVIVKGSNSDPETISQGLTEDKTIRESRADEGNDEGLI